MKSKTKSWAVGLLLLCTLITSFGQIFLKLGLNTASFDLSLLTNYNLLIGLCLYALGAILLIIALKGGELSVLFPIVATSYIWVSLLSLIFLHESMNMFKWSGIVIIIVGIILIGANKKAKRSFK